MPGVVNDGPLVIGAEVALGNELVFVTTNASGQQQLWETDGTVAGTQLLTASSGVQLGLSNFADFTEIGSTLYFTATIPGFGPQLWSTQGVAGDLVQRMTYTSGTQVGYTIPYNGSLYFTDSGAQFGPGVYSTNGVNTFFQGPLTVNTQPVILNGKLVFEGFTSQFGSGIYVSDGNPNDLTAPLPLPGFGSANDVFTVSGAQAFFTSSFSGAPPGGGIELWVTDGTSPGRLVAPFQPSDVTAFDGGVIFTGDGGQGHKSQVWFSNGGAATELFINRSLDHTPSLETGPAIAFGGKTFFLGGHDLYSTDGTTAGTTDVGQFWPSFNGPNSLLVFNNKLFAVGTNGSLMSTDGTEAGVVVLNSKPGDLLLLNGDIQQLNGKLYYLDDFDVSATDGTVAGTSVIDPHQATLLATVGSQLLIYDDGVQSGKAGLSAYNPASGTTTFLSAEEVVQFIGAIGGKQIFIGFDTTNQDQIWATDGTAAGTQMLDLSADFIGPDHTLDPQHLTVVNGLVYFNSGNGAFGDGGLFATNGTAAGAKKVFDTQGFHIVSITADGNNVLFQVNDSSQPILYSYNSTSGVTTQIGPSSAVNPFVAGSNVFFIADPNQDGNSRLEIANAGGGATVLTTATNGGTPIRGQAVGSKLFFVGEDSVHGQGLFVSDGSVAGTQFLATIPTSFSNWSFNAVGADLYFENNDPANGDELWVSDGTVAGTHRVTDTTVNGSANASGYTVMGSHVFFGATDGVHGQELWSFSGSGSATLVADVNPGAASSNPANLTVLGSTLYFTATASDGTTELWSTTGSGATEITKAANGAGVADLTAAGSELFFFGSDSSHGAGLFVSNGTAAGTSFVGAFSQAQSFHAVGGELYFNASTDEGWQLWKSDGTVAGTQQLSFARVAHDDFAGDGKSDFLIENGAGAVVTGEVVSGTASYAEVSGLGPEWSFKGDGDFLGNQTGAFLIQNTAGAVVVGDVSGGSTTYAMVTALGSEWSFRGVGDFLGAGRDQFLIENSAGAVVVGEVINGHAALTLVGGLGSEWSFRETGDFLGDGKDQFLIENTSGAVVVGEVKNGATVYTQVGGLGSEWKFVGSGDFLGHGQDDFLIENTAGAIVAGEVVNGKASYTQLTGLGPEWKFVGAGDYLGEGHDQFLIENSAGAVVVGDWTNGALHFTQVGGLGSEWVFH